MFNLLDKNSNFNIILAGIISLFLGAGIARFAYTTILPTMLDQDALSLTYSGILASLNYVGYLSGAFVAIFIKRFITKVLLFRVGLILSIITTFIFFITSSEILWLIGRIIAGFGSAMLLVVGPAIVMKKLQSKNITKTMGIYFTGIGFSIVLSDIFARMILPSWENAWGFLTLIGIVVVWYPFYILSFDKTKEEHTIHHKFDLSIFTPFVLLLIFGYCTEGFGFVIQGTFLPTILNAMDGLEKYAQNAWLLVGIAAIPSSIIWMNLASKFGSVNMIILAMLLQIVGILIPTFTSDPSINLLSGVIYGFTFAPLVALFMNLGGKIASKNPVVLMGSLTTMYGIGQITAPLYAVYFTQQTANFDMALYITATIVFFGVLGLLVAKRSYSYKNGLEK